MPRKRRKGPPLWWQNATEAEKIKAVAEAIIRCDGNKKKAAKQLGIGRRTLYVYLDKIKGKNKDSTAAMHTGMHTDAHSIEPQKPSGYDPKERLPKLLQVCEGMVANLIKQGETETARRWVETFFRGVQAKLAADRAQVQINILQAGTTEIKFLESKDFIEFMQALRYVLRRVQARYKIKDDLWQVVLHELEQQVAASKKVIEAEFREVTEQ